MGILLIGGNGPRAIVFDVIKREFIWNKKIKYKGRVFGSLLYPHGKYLITHDWKVGGDGNFINKIVWLKAKGPEKY